jgi:hypothetical protein
MGIVGGCYQLPLTHFSISVSLGDPNCLPAPLVGQQIPDSPTAATGE